MSGKNDLDKLRNTLSFHVPEKGSWKAVTPADYPKFMAAAKEQAAKGAREGGQPIGAVVVHLPTGQILGRGHNQRLQRGSRVLHAETDALENATMTGEAGGPPVPDNLMAECGMFTTMSPCPMCAGACAQFGLKLVVMAENETCSHGEFVLAHFGIEAVNLKDGEMLNTVNAWIKGPGASTWDNPELAVPLRRWIADEPGNPKGWVPS
ncbi:uncharacterized protein CcaverHIS019_0101320 [Cutaneotrichosporon cavernicola]|uniref:CMP/dCMP-type deaminase domain-containing protein n=1 Tax=Cutaneotrichosporon cavernicola TaxID=279322 RepID=A0AA48HXM6_9TREE|nr:uncharacterized protein CcaverHIS019_0101320 [Cutaneotrichosporon cavernicola]BEI87414.1 hypothetical protein CcaverHIS019_0101320 [Cutaneotrichosporon cavernicola]BEI95182.1 hypothetical protein CcaverHIS631_0101310 [Cutaneotrichosporon cavernicola]BEJ02956.1 hypothetical protein CcaverHIS641_0101310 [Cutaneotrichosporon cavernicola]